MGRVGNMLLKRGVVYRIYLMSSWVHSHLLLNNLSRASWLISHHLHSWSWWVNTIHLVIILVPSKFSIAGMSTRGWGFSCRWFEAKLISWSFLWTIFAHYIHFLKQLLIFIYQLLLLLLHLGCLRSFHSNINWPRGSTGRWRLVHVGIRRIVKIDILSYQLAMRSGISTTCSRLPFWVHCLFLFCLFSKI